MEIAGTIRQTDLPQMLREIERGQRTGRLTISNGQMQAAIYFANGQWLLAERSGPGQLLAQQFAKAGLVTPQQIEAACSVSFGQAGAIPDVQLVRALISSRTITQEQLRNWAATDAVALLAVVLGWSDGTFAFQDRVGPPPGRMALPMSTESLVSQAVKRSSYGPAHDALVVLPEAVVDFVEVDPNDGTAIHITRDQWRLLTAVDGVSPLWAIANTLQAPEQLIARLAGELISRGTVMVVGRAHRR
ncbi:MAG TPA: DUF4388 domain-containing protein [Ktedonobacterales bacterium]|nr:DUF4388 domain-containing protein [Ktedonobacterales bacterium]